MSVGISASNGNILDKFRLDGKTIVITRGARGLGLNFEHALAQAGANIASIDVNEEPHGDFEMLGKYGGKPRYYR
jgi:sorbose reductase